MVTGCVSDGELSDLNAERSGFSRLLSPCSVSRWQSTISSKVLLKKNRSRLRKRETDALGVYVQVTANSDNKPPSTPDHKTFWQYSTRRTLLLGKTGPEFDMDAIVTQLQDTFEGQIVWSILPSQGDPQLMYSGLRRPKDLRGHLHSPPVYISGTSALLSMRRVSLIVAGYRVGHRLRTTGHLSDALGWAGGHHPDHAFRCASLALLQPEPAALLAIRTVESIHAPRRHYVRCREIRLSQSLRALTQQCHSVAQRESMHVVKIVLWCRHQSDLPTQRLQIHLICHQRPLTMCSAIARPTPCSDGLQRWLAF